MRQLFLAVFVLLWSSAAFAACSSPNGVAGSLDYDVATKTQKYCDGTNWKVLTVLDDAGAGIRQRLQIASDSGACTAARSGGIRYMSAIWEQCDGTNWGALVFGRLRIQGTTGLPAPIDP